MSQVTISGLDNKATPDFTDLLEIAQQVPSAQSLHITIGSLATLFQDVTDKGIASGYASLDSGADVPLDQIPDNIPTSKISGFDAQVQTSRLDQMASPTTDVDFNASNLIEVGILQVNNAIDIDETVSVGDPDTGKGRLYVKDVSGTMSLFFRDDELTPNDTNLLTLGILAIEELTNVTQVTTFANTEILIYNFSNLQFENKAISGDITMDNAGVTTIGINTIDDTNLVSGDFNKIKGIGAQEETLNMNGHIISTVEHITDELAHPTTGFLRLNSASAIKWLNLGLTGNLSIEIGSSPDKFEFKFGATTELSLTTTDLTIDDHNLILNQGFIELEELSAAPGAPATLNFARLYIREDSGTQLFFHANGGSEINLSSQTPTLALDDLTNVSAAGALEAQFLIFNSVSSEWEIKSIGNDISALATGALSIVDNAVIDDMLFGGVYDSITGLGTQTIDLKMGDKAILNFSLIQSGSASPATTGNIQLAGADTITWKGTAIDLDLKVVSDELQFNGVVLGPGEVFSWSANHDAVTHYLENAKFADSTNPTTKKVELDLSTITGADTTLTIQFLQIADQSIELPSVASGDAFVTKNTSQILTNKELTSPTLKTPVMASVDFANAGHTHETGQGGQLVSKNALTDTLTIIYTDESRTFDTGTIQTFGPQGGSGGNAGLNVGTVSVNPDVADLDPGDVWFNTTDNTLLMFNGADIIDIGKPFETTWSVSRDGNAKNLANLGFLSFDPSDIVKLEQNGNALDVTVAAGVLSAGINIKNSDGSFITLDNSVSSVSQIRPRLTMKSDGDFGTGNAQHPNEQFFIIPLADDVGTVAPLLHWEIERDDGTKPLNRPLWDITSDTTTFLTLGNDATWTFNGLTILENLDKIKFLGITTTTLGLVSNTRIAMNDDDVISWDSTAVSTNPNFIRFNGSNEFEIVFVNDTVNPAKFTTSGLVFNNDEEIDGVQNYKFGSTVDGSTFLTADGTGIQATLVSGDFFSIVIATTPEYEFTSLIADFKGNTIKNAPIIQDFEGNTILTLTKGIGTIATSIEITNGPDVSGPQINAIGGTANVDLNFSAKGTGVINFSGFALEDVPQINDSDSKTLLSFSSVVTPTSFIVIENGVAAGPTITVGDDSLANVDLNIKPIGTGAVNIGGFATEGLSFFGADSVVQQVDGADLINNVTAGGTNDTIADYTNLVTYSMDAATIRNDIHQLARKVKIIGDALRDYGLLS